MWKRLRTWLRIAVTAVSLLVCGLLIVLWVRSYSYWDLFEIGVARENTSLFSCDGIVRLQWQCISRPRRIFEYHSDELRPIEYLPFDARSGSPSDWQIRKYANYIQVDASHWFWLSIFATTTAALPWIKWRFSLRTLLIVVTLFAVFFGAIAMSL